MCREVGLWSFVERSHSLVETLAKRLLLPAFGRTFKHLGLCTQEGNQTTLRSRIFCFSHLSGGRLDFELEVLWPGKFAETYNQNKPNSQKQQKENKTPNDARGQRSLAIPTKVNPS